MSLVSMPDHQPTLLQYYRMTRKGARPQLALVTVIVIVMRSGNLDFNPKASDNPKQS